MLTALFHLVATSSITVLATFTSHITNIVILDVAARWKTTISTEHLLKMASCEAETHRDKAKNCACRLETVYCLHTVNMHSTQNIKNGKCS